MVEKAATMEPVIKTIQDTKAKLEANLAQAKQEFEDFMSSIRKMVLDAPKKSKAVTGERCRKTTVHAAHDDCPGRQRRARGTA